MSRGLLHVRKTKIASHPPFVDSNLISPSLNVSRVTFSRVINILFWKLEVR